MTWLDLASDALIALACYSIPITLLYFVRRRKGLEFHRMFVWFTVSIVACGTTHLVEIWNTWTPIFWLSGTIKAITAIASALTAILLIKFVRRALALPPIGELTASIAHEVNQPLGSIVNNGNACIRFLASKRGAPDEVLEALSDIVNDANRASAILARIRALTKRSALEKTSFQLKDVIADVLSLAHRELDESRITARTELAEDLPIVSGNRIELQQVFLNLVRNGIEAMSAVEDERRTMTICAQVDELGGKPAVLITVEDFGCGFRPEETDRLFEPFYTTKPHGMGMGLRISRSIVEAHNGCLWATPNEGPGATLWCLLPTEENGRVASKAENTMSQYALDNFGADQRIARTPPSLREKPAMHRCEEDHRRSFPLHGQSAP